ncbi:hypothetical protein BY458DRAFT_429779 [Sporodiniella umbellata]|nr:hypothetical protein BY458DRAFT_429779 [Sporodiniella umbellata]
MSSTEEIESYKFQLEQVELALASDTTNEELLKLQSDLKELIAMFEAQLPEQNIKPSRTKVADTEAPATALKTQIFSVDQEVLARWSGDGQFYKANITAIGGADQVFSVRFKGYNETEFVKAEDIKAIANKKRVGIFEEVKKNNPNAIFLEEMNKKKKTAAADQAKITKKKQATEIEHKKNAWLNFATVGGKKKHSPINKKSIFKSPDNPGGKVGVVGSGKGMTTYLQRGKHVYADSEEK